jgi:hypothetical protein
MQSHDSGINRYDPHHVSQSYKDAIVNYRKERRIYKSLERQKEEKEKSRYLFFRFQSNDKHSVEDAKAKARTDEEVVQFYNLMEEQEKKVDYAFGELERCIWKKELMLDANATSRKEMELTRIET